MTTAFEVDINTIANSFSTMVPIVEETYDLTPRRYFARARTA